MPVERIVVDGLWRCLCPSIDITYLSKPFGLQQLPRAQLGCISRRGSPAKPRQRQCRRHYGEAATLERDDGTRADEAIERSRRGYLTRVAKRSPWVPGALFQDPGPHGANLDKIPTRSVYAALKELQDTEDKYFPIVRLAEYLVKQREEPPNAALYEALIRANICKHHGSAKAAARLLKEAQSHNISTTPDFYYALLEVTAVHPDYVLRAQALHDMKNRWYGLTPSGEVSIILGLLRDSQYELALCKLEALGRIPVNVPPWLFDVFLYIFGDLGFHEETLAILKHRERLVDVLKRAPVSLNVWHFLLDVFSRDAFQAGIKYVWDHSVATGHIHPPDGSVEHVLNAAAAHGDMTLAMSAALELSTRGTKLSMHHYEALIHVHVRHGDLRKALTILCIMAKAGLSPDLASTRPIYHMLHDSPTLTEAALRILHALKAEYTVPPAAFNVVLECTAAHGRFTAAFDLYRTIRQVCTHGPDLETFDILFRYCTIRKSMNFLVAEMEAFSLRPNWSILDHLIRISSMQDDYEMAFHYLEMMRTHTPDGSPEMWWASKSSILALLRRCVQDRDERFENLLAECRRRRLLNENDFKSLLSVERQGVDALQSQTFHTGQLEQHRLGSAQSQERSSAAG
ncbi:hypothetical protein F4777DRAFT_580533 [Nemania sp. FL0916]|nr:hypothetical protein F4777DRAFT_580533 [Nemania sp. FL0916]